MSQVEYGTWIQAGMKSSKVLWVSELKSIISDPDFKGTYLNGAQMELDSQSRKNLQLIR